MSKTNLEHLKEQGYKLVFTKDDSVTDDYVGVESFDIDWLNQEYVPPKPKTVYELIKEETE